MKKSTRYRNLVSTYDKTREYDVDKALELLKNLSNAKFDETVEAAVKLGVDPRKSDQMVRGSVILPYGTGKKVRLLVLCKPAKEAEAQKAGADFVGLEDYIEKIKAGWTDIDVVVATPDVMSMVGKLGKILGPRGLMPNPKVGTVTMDVGAVVGELKKGRVSFRVDKTGIVHLGIGKISFEALKLKDNFETLMRTIVRLRPATAKGQYVKSIALSTTMGPGVKLSRSSIFELLK
ncbi:MAG: 50S ribosomal protein L1 [candidate division Zixibacteria bacterium]|nr:50S ribosomal protein L1 [Candidatus Tariuqbacter arcticus]